jgi:hypothetical protein
VSRRPRIVAPRENAPEHEFRRQVSESLRDLSRTTSETRRVQRFEREVTGGDTGIELRLDATQIAKGPPWGVTCVYVLHIASAAPGILEGSVPWAYAVRDGIAYARISSLPGLTAGEKYRVRFDVTEGNG